MGKVSRRAAEQQGLVEGGEVYLPAWLTGGIQDMAKRWFSMDASSGASKILPRSEGGTVAKVEILGPIGGWDVSGSQFLRELSALGDVDTIDLRIHSPGGEVLDGWAIANGLKNHPAKVVARVEGMAASMGSVVMCAADEVEMPKNAYVMIHNVSGGVWGEADEMRSAADLVDKLQNDIVDFYAERTGIEGEEIAEMMRVETWLNGSEAVEMGFADRVLEPVAAAAVVAGVDFENRFENAPAGLVEGGEVSRRAAEQQGLVEGDDDEGDLVEEEEEALVEELTEEVEKISDANEKPKGFVERVKSALGLTSDGEEKVAEKGPSASVALAAAIDENATMMLELANVRSERDEFEAESNRLKAEMLTVEDLIAQAGFSPAEAADLPSPQDDFEGLGARSVLEEFETMSAGPNRSAFLKANEGEIFEAMRERG